MTTWNVPDDIDYDKPSQYREQERELEIIRCAHKDCDALVLVDGSGLCEFHDDFYEWIASIQVTKHMIERGKINE